MGGDTRMLPATQPINMKHKCPNCGCQFSEAILKEESPPAQSTEAPKDDDGLGLVTGMGIVAAETEMFSGGDVAPDTTPDTSSSFDSGGGDMGGGGAGSDY